MMGGPTNSPDTVETMVERLRAWADHVNDAALASDLDEAADLILSLKAENEALKHDLERQMTIANAECNEVESLRAELDEAREALRLAVRIADSWIHDQLDGTSSLDGALAELEPARAALKENTNG